MRRMTCLLTLVMLPCSIVAISKEQPYQTTTVKLNRGKVDYWAYCKDNVTKSHTFRCDFEELDPARFNFSTCGMSSSFVRESKHSDAEPHKDINHRIIYIPTPFVVLQNPREGACFQFSYKLYHPGCLKDNLYLIAQALINGTKKEVYKTNWAPITSKTAWANYSAEINFTQVTTPLSVRLQFEFLSVERKTCREHMTTFGNKHARLHLDHLCLTPGRCADANCRSEGDTCWNETDSASKAADTSGKYTLPPGGSGPTKKTSGDGSHTYEDDEDNKDANNDGAGDRDKDGDGGSGGSGIERWWKAVVGGTVVLVVLAGGGAVLGVVVLRRGLCKGKKDSKDVEKTKLEVAEVAG